jgi:hypothetical protein
LIAAATIAANRITGSASINAGTFPAVSDTIAEQKITRHIPDDNITRAASNLFQNLAIRYEIPQIAAPINGYRSSIVRGIVPPAFPSRS